MGMIKWVRGLQVKTVPIDEEADRLARALARQNGITILGRL